MSHPDLFTVLLHIKLFKTDFNLNIVCNLLQQEYRCKRIYSNSAYSALPDGSISSVIKSTICVLEKLHSFQANNMREAYTPKLYPFAQPVKSTNIFINYQHLRIRFNILPIPSRIELLILHKISKNITLKITTTTPGYKSW